MSVIIETTLGDITVDLFLKDRPTSSYNFLKLCKIKYYNYNLFHTIQPGFIAQTGDPTGTRKGGESIYGVIDGNTRRFFEAEKTPKIKHTSMGLLSFVGNEEGMIGSQIFFTLGKDLSYLDDKHCVFAEVMEGLDVLELLNETICDADNRPYKDVRITHTVILDDPFNDPKGLQIPERSPSPSEERLSGGRIAADEEIDDSTGKSAAELCELLAEKEAKARATILEMVGDIPDADMAPPENVLFVCKLNPVTTEDDLEIIFSRFGKIVSCEIIKDKKTGDSLQYAFVEFDNPKSCEDAYFKMDNVLIDDRRIHVDFSQSVAKVKWLGKGRGVATYDEDGRRMKDGRNDLGKGIYKRYSEKKPHKPFRRKSCSRSPRRRSPHEDRSRHNRKQERGRDDRVDKSYERKYRGDPNQRGRGRNERVIQGNQDSREERNYRRYQDDRRHEKEKIRSDNRRGGNDRKESFRRDDKRRSRNYERESDHKPTSRRSSDRRHDAEHRILPEESSNCPSPKPPSSQSRTPGKRHVTCDDSDESISKKKVHNRNKSYTDTSESSSYDDEPVRRKASKKSKKKKKKRRRQDSTSSN